MFVGRYLFKHPLPCIYAEEQMHHLIESVHPNPSRDSFLTLVELLRWRAAHQADQRAYTFLINGEIEGSTLSYAMLDEQARAIGSWLQKHIVAGDRALLMFPSGLDFIAAFFGCLYAGVIAVPAYPPHPRHIERTLPRLRAIMNNAQPTVVLTTSSILTMLQQGMAFEPCTPRLHWIATDTIACDEAAKWEAPHIHANTIAFLQYTSGSTSVPRGVIVTHDNVLENQRMIREGFQSNEDTLHVSWLPLFHDLGLIGNVVHALYLGTPCILMSPTAFLQRPIRWLEAISRYRAHASGGPNSAYELCLQRIRPDRCTELDLSSWTLAINGAEPIHLETLNRFANAFASCGFRREAFYPGYGLAEATLFVTGGSRMRDLVTTTVNGSALAQSQVVPASPKEADTHTFVGCGYASSGQTIVIVDPATGTRCSHEHIGEIWVSSTSVAHGYWNRPGETNHTFRAQLIDETDRFFLRTGDLGFIQEGELFVTGRIKDMIIINGQNLYPQDIEWTVDLCHPAIRSGCCAAFSIEVDGEERLVVVAELERKHQSLRRETGVIDEIVRAVRRAVLQYHNVHVHTVEFLKIGSLPKTSSGKIQRHACKFGFLNRSLDTLEVQHESHQADPSTTA